MEEHDRQVQRVIDAAAALFRSPLRSLFTPAWSGSAEPVAWLSTVLARILETEAEAAIAPPWPLQVADHRGDELAGPARGSPPTAAPAPAQPADLRRATAADLAPETARLTTSAERLAPIVPAALLRAFADRPLESRHASLRSGARVGRPLASEPRRGGGASREPPSPWLFAPSTSAPAAAPTHPLQADGAAARAAGESVRIVETPAALEALLRAHVVPIDPVTVVQRDDDHGPARAPRAVSPAGSRELSPARYIRRADPPSAPHALPPEDGRAIRSSSEAPAARVPWHPRSPGPLTLLDGESEVAYARGSAATADGPARTEALRDGSLVIPVAHRAAAAASPVALSAREPLPPGAEPGALRWPGAANDGMDPIIAEELLLDRLLDRLEDRLREQQIRQFGLTGGEI